MTVCDGYSHGVYSEHGSSKTAKEFLGRNGDGGIGMGAKAPEVEDRTSCRDGESTEYDMIMEVYG